MLFTIFIIRFLIVFLEPLASAGFHLLCMCIAQCSLYYVDWVELIIFWLIDFIQDKVLQILFSEMILFIFWNIEMISPNSRLLNWWIYLQYLWVNMEGFFSILKWSPLKWSSWISWVLSIVSGYQVQAMVDWVYWLKDFCIYGRHFYAHYSIFPKS